jgi:hypothetical protein
MKILKALAILTVAAQILGSCTVAPTDNTESDSGTNVEMASTSPPVITVLTEKLTEAAETVTTDGGKSVSEEGTTIMEEQTTKTEEQTTIIPVTTPVTETTAAVTKAETEYVATTVKTEPPVIIPPAKPDVNAELYIHSINELNKGDAVINSHAESLSATLEENYRGRKTLAPGFLGVGDVTYPRIKKLAEDDYILFYESRASDPKLFYTKSSDLLNWEKPKALVQKDSEFSHFTPEAILLPNGELLCVISRISKNRNIADRPQREGLYLLRSSDKGETWSDMVKIYSGITWEASFLLLSSGELQIYFTNVTMLPAGDSSYSSTGTGLIRSYDYGKTWSSNPNVPYDCEIASQQKTEVIEGVQMWSDQMPVAIQLNNSNTIALALETRLNREDSYRVSYSYSSDNWATSLKPFTEEGPEDRFPQIWKGTGPYIRQFPSGEVILSYAHSKKMHIAIADGTAKNMGPAFSILDGTTRSLWSAMEILTDHSILAVTDDTVTLNDGTTDYYNIRYAPYILNHRINAPVSTPTLDGDNVEWYNPSLPLKRPKI